MKLSKLEVQRRQRTQSGLLNEELVAHIKWRIGQGQDKRLMAQDYGVALGTIRAIARGDTWAWVDPVYGGTEQLSRQPRDHLSDLLAHGKPPERKDVEASFEASVRKAPSNVLEEQLAAATPEELASPEGQLLIKVLEERQSPGMDKLQKIAAKMPELQVGEMLDELLTDNTQETKHDDSTGT